MSDTAPERPLPTNVIAALARVMEELPGIGRNERSQQGYNYRGIEAITREASSLLGRYGVVFVPKVVERKTIDLTVNGKPWTEDHATIVYTVYGPGGVEDRIEVGPLIALGRDNSDKGMNKCMTQAFKYALLQTLCIGDSKDDADAGHAVEADGHGRPSDDPEAWFPSHGWKDRAEYDAARKSTNEALTAAPEPVKVAFKAWWADQGHDWKDAWPKPLADAVAARLEAMIAERAEPSVPGADGPIPTPTLQTPGPGPESAPVADSEPLPDPDPTTMALIAFVESLPARQVGEALEARNAALSGASKIRQQRLAKLLAGEGWTPGRGHLPVAEATTPAATVPPGLPEPLCAWCGHRVSTKGELPGNAEGGWMHEPCRIEWADDKAESEKPF